MTKKEAIMLELLRQALYDLKEHRSEYHHQGQPGLIEAIEEIIQETK